MMQSVILTRKERIMRERAIIAKSRTRKVVGFAIAGSVAASVLLSTNSAKALACSDTYVVKKGDNLYSLAKKYGVSVEQIQDANKLSSDFIKEGQILEVPLLEDAHSEQPEPSATKMVVSQKQEKISTTKKTTNKVYTVVLGDSLSLLAEKFGVSIKQIQDVNRLTSDMIKVGQKLEIPSEKVLKAKKQAIKKSEEKATYATYTVSAGESLWSIARQFNTSTEEIKVYNQLSSDAVLIGQKLIIKQKNLVKVDATVGGAVDNFSVEFMINGVPTVLKVAYGTASNFERISGKEIELVYYKANRSALVSFSLAK